MRLRATVAVSLGALAVTGLAVPAAQADGGYGNTRITKVVVDGDNKVQLSTSGVKTITVSVTATDNSGIAGADPFDLYGPGYGLLTTGKPVCKAAGATTSTCTASVRLDPRSDDIVTSNAGIWHVDAWIDAKDEDFVWKENAGSFWLQRAAKLAAADATPEPVKKGKLLTVKSGLTRANWDNLKFGGYAGAGVQLQYQKKGAKTWTTLKTVKADSKGNLKTTVKATADGSYRYSFPGNSTTAAVASGADYVDVK
ncbi:calcium-binding protein [Streptomyces roseirectus]|uniref:Calcium-binding protein n=1 Tax=Streptomyces roseirectus TaxID=2768066 RepID=A0A7H0IGS9_9ACTN|nr:calcium-binding protein [Streptomyces roseirectus]QNP71995.1 calcium-binding protein [Streptomyces roseirectus]